MWPDDEMDEDDRSVADADIAGARTTLQPALHLTTFVPVGWPTCFSRVFKGGSAPVGSACVGM